MKTKLSRSRQFEFCFSQLDTLVLVEESEEGIVVRATRASFSIAQKTSFLRYLAAEGFLSESYGRLENTRPPRGQPVAWLVDASWLKAEAAQAARTTRFMIRFIAGAWVLWLIMMTSLFIR
jgi:hypothetical protein